MSRGWEKIYQDGDAVDDSSLTNQVQFSLIRGILNHATQSGTFEAKSSSVPVRLAVLLNGIGPRRAETLDGTKLKAKMQESTVRTRCHLLTRVAKSS